MEPSGFLAPLVAGEDSLLLHTVLSFLDNGSLSACSRVSKRFFMVAIECMDPNVDDNRAIQWACELSHLESVPWLLDDGIADSQALNLASYLGHTEAMRMLLKDGRADPSADDSSALQIAICNGHASIVQLLLEDGRADPSANDNYAIRIASEKGHTEIVRMLLLNDDGRAGPPATAHAADRCIII